MPKPPKRPRDPNQLAKMITDIATGEVEESDTPQRMEATEKGRRGGTARRNALTPDQRKEIAQVAALARWKKD
jgi:hypothetical protein